jgi:tRNA pseudouridine13 synthase
MFYFLDFHSLTNDQLKLGDLNGNRFTIVLRQMNCKDDGLIVKCVESLAQNGFINYYGLQRFGTSSIPTHEIGL